MLICEFQLAGTVRFSEMDEARLLIRAQIDAEAACLPIPQNMDEAQEHLRANCYQLEIFDSLELAENWAENYGGFRAGQARAELRRFAFRRAGKDGPNGTPNRDLYLEPIRPKAARELVA